MRQSMQSFRMAFYRYITDPKQLTGKMHRICPKIHQKEDLGVLSSKTQPRASNEARKATKNAFLVFGNFGACGGRILTIKKKHPPGPFTIPSETPSKIITFGDHFLKRKKSISGNSHQTRRTKQHPHTNQTILIQR